MAGEYSWFETVVYEKFTATAFHDWTRRKLIPDIDQDTTENGSVLDVGCGGGRFALNLKQTRPDLDITGIDLTEDMIERARNRSRDEERDVSFDVGDALYLPYESNKLDYVVSIGSFKHWPDQKRGLEECLRVLKPGGNLKLVELEKDLSWSEYYSFLLDLNHPPVIREFFFPFFVYVVEKKGVSHEIFSELIERTDYKLDDVLIHRADKTDDFDVPLIVLDAKLSE